MSPKYPNEIVNLASFLISSVYPCVHLFNILKAFIDDSISLNLKSSSQ
jgi:hypothetical protein